MNPNRRQLIAIKLLAYLATATKPILLPVAFDYMQGGITLSISDLLLSLVLLKKAGFIEQNGNKLMATPRGKELSSKS